MKLRPIENNSVIITSNFTYTHSLSVSLYLVYVCIYIYIYIYIYMCVCVCVYVCVHTCAHLYIIVTYSSYQHWLWIQSIYCRYDTMVVETKCISRQNTWKRISATILIKYYKQQDLSVSQTFASHNLRIKQTYLRIRPITSARQYIIQIMETYTVMQEIYNCK